MEAQAEQAQQSTGNVYAAAMAEMDAALSAVGTSNQSEAEKPGSEVAPPAEAGKEPVKAEAKPEPEKQAEETGDDPADILAAAIRRDKESSRRDGELRKRESEIKELEARAGSIKSLFEAGDIVGLVKAIKPDIDLAELHLTLLEGLTKEDKPLSPDDVKRMVAEERAAAEKAAKEAREKQDKESYENGVKQYMGTCQSIVSANEAKFPVLSFPGMLEFFQPRIVKYLEDYYAETKGIAQAAPTMEMLETRLGAELRRRLGVATPAQTGEPTTLTNANTADTSGAPPPAGRRESRYEQAMREADEKLQKMVK